MGKAGGEEAKAWERQVSRKQRRGKCRERGGKGVGKARTAEAVEEEAQKVRSAQGQGWGPAANSRRRVGREEAGLLEVEAVGEGRPVGGRARERARQHLQVDGSAVSNVTALRRLSIYS